MGDVLSCGLLFANPVRQLRSAQQLQKYWWSNQKSREHLCECRAFARIEMLLGGVADFVCRHLTWQVSNARKRSFRHVAQEPMACIVEQCCEAEDDLVGRANWVNRATCRARVVI